jgi:uncharacterized protein DUF559
MERDANTTERLSNLGWDVIRFWGHEIIRMPDVCAAKVVTLLEEKRSRAAQAHADAKDDSPGIAKSVQPVLSRASGRGLVHASAQK